MGGASSTAEPHRLLGCGGLGINDLTCPCMERSAVVCQASRPHARLPPHQYWGRCTRLDSTPACEILRERATVVLTPEPNADYAARAYAGEV